RRNINGSASLSKPVVKSADAKNVSPKPWREYANDPLGRKFARRQATNLRDFLHDKLPEYMIPATFMSLDALPLTPTGKLDRRALAAPSREDQSGFASPVQTIEHQLVQIWEEILDIRPIGIRDNFFELGGHSLLAARMVYRIEQVCGEKLSLST